MSSRKPVVVAAFACTALLFACKDNSVTTPEPPAPAVKVQLLPDSITIKQGRTQQLTAIVTNTTNQAVAWSTSDAAVATVSGSGVVTGVSPGIATIKAASQADPNALDITVVRVAELTPPQALIIGITQSNAQVNSNDVQGTISVAARVASSNDVTVNRAEFAIDNQVVTSCTHLLTADETSAGQASVPCEINTAGYDLLTGKVTYVGGSHVLAVRAVLGNASVAAAVSQNLVFTNPNFLQATVRAARAPVPGVPAPHSLAAAGLPWHGGSITIDVVPVLFRNAPTDSIAQVSVLATTSGAGVTGISGCLPTGVATSTIANAVQDPTIAAADGGGGPPGTNSGSLPNCVAAVAVQIDATAANGFSVTFPDSLPMTAGGVAGIEESLVFTINATTRGGAPGPACINPSATNPLGGGTNGANCGTGLGTASAPNRIPTDGAWLHDNLAPRFTSLNIKRNGTEPFFNNQTFTGTIGGVTNDSIVGAGIVDYGVGIRPALDTTKFLAGPTTGELAEIRNTNTLTERQEGYVFQARARDALGNQRAGTATSSRFVIADGAGAVPVPGFNLQFFGVDFTAPQLTIANSPADSTAGASGPAIGVFTLAAADPGTLASGFPLNQFRVKAELITSAGTTCYWVELGVVVSCTTGNGFYPSDGDFTLPGGAEGYWRVSFYVSDRAGNTSQTRSRLQLADGTYPVVGSISAPAIITGGQPASFGTLVTDNIDLRDYTPFTAYAENGLAITIDEAATVLGTFGPDVLAAQASATTSIAAFIRSVETTTGVLPSGMVARATDFNYWVRDEANNLTGQSLGILPSVIAGIGGSGTESSWLGAGRAFSAAVNPVPSYRITTAPATICVDADVDGCTTPASRALTATATGPAFNFGNPFARLSFYYRNPLTGHLVFIGSANATSADNGTTNTRTWTYSGVSFTAPAGLPAGTVFNVVAIGVDFAGRALLSGAVSFAQVID